MAQASSAQFSFLGGEWSPEMQGRADRPDYKIALNLCRNALPIEQGSWNRRPGTRYAWHTRGGAQGRVLAYPIQQQAPYLLELTNGFLRLGSGVRGYLDLASTNDAQTVIGINSASPAVVGTANAHGWSTGNTVKFLWSGAKNNVGAALQGRQFVITVTDNKHFSLADPITGTPINGAQFLNVSNPSGLSVMRVLEFATPYTTAQLNSVRKVDATNDGVPQSILLQGSNIPQVLTVTALPSGGADGTFTLSPVNFQDGPYLDPIQNSVVKIGGVSGVITITVSFQIWSSSTPYSAGDRVTVTAGDTTSYQSLVDGNVGNTPSTSPAQWQPISTGLAVKRNGAGFLASDIGRLARIFATPSPWSSSGSYVAGNLVTYGGTAYLAIASSSGATPPISPSDWEVVTTASAWAWGKITAVSTIAVASFQFEHNDFTGLPYTNLTMTLWQLGLYGGAETGWPTCGCFHEGRLWLAGAVPNRFDASVAGTGTGQTADAPSSIFSFEPTDIYGVVSDDSAISETLNASDQNTIFWMEPDFAGITVGTEGGEWLIQSASAATPITPTSIQARRQTRYGCANIEPARTPLTTVFVQKYQRKTMELFADVFSGRYSAPNLSETANHLTATNLQEIRYQNELAPVIWGRCGDGSLVGTTYKRVTLFSSQGPEFVGWHKHTLGSGRTVQSVTVGPSIDGTLDSLAMVTLDSGTGIYHVETLTNIFDPTNGTLQSAWFLDDAVAPGPNGSRGGFFQTSGGTPILTFTGLWHLNGKTVTVWCGGVDLGDFPVQNGQLSVTVSKNPNALFNVNSLGSLTTSGVSYGQQSVTIDNLDDPSGAMTYTVPCVIGFTYTSQGQRLRAINPPDAGTPLGPALGKVRRAHQFAALCAGTQGISFGTDFTNMHAAVFLSQGGSGASSLPASELFSGVHWDTVEAQSDFDNMLAWQVTRPYPAVICAAETFLQGQER